ncbi:MAG: hypothetical protein ABI690_09920 [Chloroflexota bacterium]
MNEQQFADELGARIDNRADDLSGQLPVEDSAFMQRLLTLRDQTTADVVFADALEAQLKAAAHSSFRNRPQSVNRGSNYGKDRRGRLVYTMATFAAALVIVAFAVLTVPSLRSLTQNVYSQIFVQSPQSVPVTQTVTSLPTAPPEQHPSGYVLATAPLSSGFHVMGQVFHANDFAVSLLESAFTSYVNLMSSVYSESGSSS